MSKLLIACLLAAAGITSSSCATMTPAPSPLSWNFAFDGAEAKLAYGRPNSDEVGLMMTCAPHSGLVSVSGAVHAESERLVLTSGRISTTLEGASEPDPLSGANWFTADTRLGKGALAQFRRTGQLSVESGGRKQAMHAVGDDRGAVAHFYQACA